MGNPFVQDEQALHALLNEQRPRLVRLCAYLTGDAVAAEDLAQETLLEAWRHIARLRDPEAVTAWLSGIARHVSLDWLRARGRAAPMRALDIDIASPSSELVDPFDLELDLERHEVMALLERALALLPEETRNVLLQRYIWESPHREIAERLGVSENAVAVRLHRGKLALRQVLATQLRDEMAAYGAPVEEAGWQETRIWCTGCGQRRLVGRFTEEEFVLRCPSCSIEPNAYYAQSRGSGWLFQGVRGYRPALNRFQSWMYNYFRDAVERGEGTCLRCKRKLPLRMGLPAYAPASERAKRGMHLFCDACGAGSYQTLDGMVIDLAQARAFWRAHTRIRTLPEREVEFGGRPALVVTLESVRAPASLDVIVGAERFDVLAIEEASHG